jgi:hypothetical protein
MKICKRCKDCIVIPTELKPQNLDILVAYLDEILKACGIDGKVYVSINEKK